MLAVQYQITIADLSARTLNIKLTFMPDSLTHELVLASWIPGSYMIRNFARHIMHIRAFDTLGELNIQQQDKQRWQLACRESMVTIEYVIYANDLSVRAAFIDDEVAVLNPACLCLAVSGLEQLPHQLILHKPQHSALQNWRVATALPRENAQDLYDFGTFIATDYAHLIDSPIIAGIFSVQQFSLDGVPHYVVVTGNNLFDHDRLTTDVEKLCQVQRNVFGCLPEDLNQYWFLLWVTEQGYGGLEHQFSTLLLCNRSDLPITNSIEQDDSYHTLLGLFSHEYFHTWWVTRLKPSCFHPYQLDKEQYSRQLWMYEGFTSYFDDLALVQSGLISQKQYLSLLEKLISRVTRNPSEHIQSLTESSFTAWTKFYLQDENAVNSIVSYYAKGALVALLLDAELRQQGYSLASLCRQLYQDYLVTGTAEASIFTVLKNWQLPQLAEQLLLWINQPSPLPLQPGLAKLGLTLTWRNPSHIDDLGGSTTKPLIPSLGCSLKTQPQGIFVHQLYVNSAAHHAGLMSGDQLVALANFKVTESSLVQLLKRLPVGSVQELVVFRKDRLLKLNLTISVAAPFAAILSIDAENSINHWLGNE